MLVVVLNVYALARHYGQPSGGSSSHCNRIAAEKACTALRTILMFTLRAGVAIHVIKVIAQLMHHPLSWKELPALELLGHSPLRL